MKKIVFYILYFLIGACVTSCKSNEEKALALIDHYMLKSLYDYDSYQPVETKIDSAFYSPYTNKELLASAQKVDAAYDETMKNMKEASHAMEIAAIWADSYSSYSRSKYRKASNEAKEYKSNAEAALKTMLQEMKFINVESKKISTDFYGWNVTHTFRCKTKGGYADIGNYVFIIDENFENILTSLDMNDEDLTRYVEWIKRSIENYDEWLELEKNI